MRDEIVLVFGMVIGSLFVVAMLAMLVQTTSGAGPAPRHSAPGAAARAG